MLEAYSNKSQNFMFVIDDRDVDNAARQLRSAGFQDCTWSCGSRHPTFYKGSLLERIYRRIVNDYSNLDRNSVRFVFPPGQQSTSKVVLLPASYAHICVKLMPGDTLARDDNIFYPQGAPLLRSFVQTLVREPVAGMWTSCLSMWAVSYVYGELMLADDVLDLCDDEAAKAWFNKHILRSSHGIDRVTCTKRLGRKGYDETLARGGLT
ncbi:hypothetical protein MY4824_009754 [Beauveria thailandica]